MTDSSFDNTVVKYRLYPFKSQELELFGVLETLREVHNELLERRINSWKWKHVSLNGASQRADLARWNGRSTRIYSSDALYYCGGEPTVKMETLRRELRRAVRDAEERSEQPVNPKTGHGLVHQASHHAYWLGVRDGVKDALTRSKRVPL